MTKVELLERIESFKGLEKGWDSYDGDIVLIETIELAKSVVAILNDSDEWFVSPCGDGEILFESMDSKKYIKVIFLPK